MFGHKERQLSREKPKKLERVEVDGIVETLLKRILSRVERYLNILYQLCIFIGLTLQSLTPKDVGIDSQYRYVVFIMLNQ